MADGSKSPHAGGPTHAELLETAKTFTEPFRARAGDAEKNRRVHRETHEGLLDAGFYRMQMPARYGGMEMSHRTMLDVSVEIGRGCGSSSWIFTNIVDYTFSLVATSRGGFRGDRKT